MKVPRPREGWRVFLGEVGVIVLGVLIALGAQEWVERLRIQADVATFRATINHEIAINLWVYEHRLRQADCMSRRLARFENALAVSANGTPVALDSADRPFFYSLYRAAWDTRDPDVFAALPAGVRRQYAEFYDELANNELSAAREREAWERLLPYEVPGPLSLEDRRALHQAIRMVARSNSNIVGNLDTSREMAHALGIRAAQPNGMNAEDVAKSRRCPVPR